MHALSYLYCLFMLCCNFCEDLHVRDLKARPSNMYFLCDETIINHILYVNLVTVNIWHDYACNRIYIYSADCIHINSHVIFTRIKSSATDLPNLLKLNFANAGQVINMKKWDIHRPSIHLLNGASDTPKYIFAVWESVRFIQVACVIAGNHK